MKLLFSFANAWVRGIDIHKNDGYYGWTKQMEWLIHVRLRGWLK